MIDVNFKKYQIKAYPIFFDKSVPGGPIQYSFFKERNKKFLKILKSKLPLDGVLLIMHGAMYLKEINDPEGYWIQSVRKLVGKNCIVSMV